MGLLNAQIKWINSARTHNKYPLIVDQMVAKNIASILEGPNKRDVVNLTAGLCLIEQNLSKPPVALFEQSNLLDIFQNFKSLKGERQDYLEPSCNKSFENLNLSENTAIFATVNDKLFSLAVTLWTHLMFNHQSFWKNHPLPLYVLCTSPKFRITAATTSTLQYQRISVLAQTFTDLSITSKLPLGTVLPRPTEFILFQMVPKPCPLVSNFHLYNNFLKQVFSAKATTLETSLIRTAPNANVDFRNSSIYRYKNEAGQELRNLRVDAITANEYQMIFNEWCNWSCAKNGLLRNFKQ